MYIYEYVCICVIYLLTTSASNVTRTHILCWTIYKNKCLVSFDFYSQLVEEQDLSLLIVTTHWILWK